MLSEVNLIGHVEHVYWYELEDGRIVSFHVAETDDGHITLYSDRLTFPSITAGKLGIAYSFMRNATSGEVDAFLLNNPNIKIKKVIDIV